MGETNTQDARGESIDDLLHDAERAFGGYEFALTMGDSPNAALLREKADRLFTAAHAFDPRHTDPAWTECDAGFIARMMRRLSPPIAESPR